MEVWRGECGRVEGQQCGRPWVRVALDVLGGLYGTLGG